MESSTDVTQNSVSFKRCTSTKEKARRPAGHTGNLYKESNRFYYNGAREYFIQHSPTANQHLLQKQFQKVQTRTWKGMWPARILIQYCLVFQLHVTPIKCSRFLANVAKEFALVYVLCAYTRVTTCLTMTHGYYSGTRDTHICSCSGLARCTKCHKIQNDRKYKHQFVFQVLTRYLQK